MESIFELNEIDLAPETPIICGYLSTHGMTNADGDAEKKYIELAGKSISIVGKNGTGKSTILSELALTARPWAHVYFKTRDESLNEVMNQSKFPFWRGGFILSCPSSYIGPLNQLRNIKNLNLNHPDSVEREILSFLYTPPGSDLAANFNRHEVDFNNNHYFAEYETYQEEMQRSSKIGLFPVRVQTAHSATGPVDDPLESSWAISRVVFRNEDTATLNLLVNDYVNFLKSLSESENPITYGQFLDSFSHHRDVEVEIKPGDKFSLTTFPIYDNPHFTPWSLGGLLIWGGADQEDVRDDIKRVLESYNEISIERPKHLISFDNFLPIVAAIDSKILNLSSHSDLEQMLYGFPQKSVTWGGTRKVDLLENWEKLKPRIIEILTEWEVIYSVTAILNWELKLEIDSVTGNFQDVTGEFNETARCWIHRAWQIAVIENFDSPYKIAIWDEPEVGLHPTALDTVATRVIPFVTKLGIKLIYSTHSMRLAIAAEQIKACARDEFSRPYLSDWQGINRESAHSLGFTKIDLLENISKIIVVEGEMDREVLNVIFESELEIHRARIVTLAGTSNLLTIPDAEILIESLNSKILIVLDGLSRSNLTEEFISGLNLACQSGDWMNVKKCIWEIRQKAQNLKDEGQKLIKLLDLISNRGDNEIVKRFEFFMFTSLDISNELPIKGVLGEATQFKDWEAVIQAMKERNISISSGNQKKFLENLGTPITKKTCLRGALKLMDLPLSGGFNKFKSVAFESI
jgi:energy-coupling factor transporter ATP-binding protein EcfA2